MKIEDALKGTSPTAFVREFLDSDISGEVYTTPELVERLLLPNDNFRSSTTLQAYSASVMNLGKGQVRLWWGNPVAIQRLKEFVAHNGKA